MQKGTVHLIPNILAENTANKMPQYLVDVINRISIFYVEEIRSARRFLKMMNRNIVIDDLTFHILNEHHQESLTLAKDILQSGKDIAYISEAGCPAVADPGQDLVKIAHTIDAKVIPYIGPNSIILALMASGFNGQQFYFHGYLPNKQPMLSQKIKEIEAKSRTNNCTEIFIETPYRNNQLIEEILRNCNDNTWFCVASNLTAEDEKIVSKTVKDWKKIFKGNRSLAQDETNKSEHQLEYNFHKKPCVMLLYAF